ncbi:GlsB/YeaQ/YmgE family stress response membrane protein [Corynebacterium resistens]|uniref:GlsB/YeaQ/YmgE family stress response membrane protein n=1 Tax=Corynebacterium resistens TaxID=258224 RepID=UPI002353EF2C|nr:GlsB/YeaQ/YmgE family stress response membrane protein [Corynebacterium resistens]
MTTEILAESTQLLAADSGVPALGFIGWIIIGGLAGWIGSKIMGTDAQMGIFANIIVGVIGGFLGGWIFTLLGIDSGGWIFSFITCLIGACLLLWIIKLFTGKKGRS